MMDEYDLHESMVSDLGHRLNATEAELRLVRRENNILRQNAIAQNIIDDVGAAGKSRASQIRTLTRIIHDQRRELSRLIALQSMEAQVAKGDG